MAEEPDDIDEAPGDEESEDSSPEEVAGEDLEGAEIVLPPPGGGEVRDHLLDEEMKDSYLTYAMSVIIQRALPDARDGLKPSQRRILVAMHDLNLGPRAKFRKCAKIAGDTTGNYHPHGDQVVYPTLVRLAQDFNMRYPLIHPQGNFGYIDGSPPAAMRYTEARMAEPAVDLLDDIDKETVDFVRNYDDTRDEPTVLPSRFPNLICNGSQGIAVGMATSIPPHNLSEIADALIALIRNPNLGVHDLLALVPGPDFPTGGIICGRQGIVRAYTTGRGLITVRSRWHAEELRGDRQRIVFTELPYQVNYEALFERLKDLVQEGTLKAISDFNDESDRKAGLRIVLDLRKGENPDVVVNQLFKLTPLQQTFSIILLALSQGRPKTFSLRDLLLEFRDHRVDVIQRRTRFLLRRAEERLHIVEGLRIAVAHIDEVVRIIRESADVDTARANLTARFLLSARQADAILQMRLSRLTGLEVEKLEEERRQLLADIERFRSILADVRLVHEMIIDEMTELKARYPGRRRTEILDVEGEIEDEALIPLEEAVVTVSHQGYMKRMRPDLWRTQARGGKGVTAADVKDGDFVQQLITAMTHDTVLIFTDQGRLYWLKVHQIPEMSRQSRGRAIVNLLALREDEKATSVIGIHSFDDRFLVMATRSGVIKKTPLSAFSNPREGGIIACTLDEGDRLIGTALTRGDQHIILGTAKGQAIRFSEKTVRPMGRTARGVIGIKLRGEGDSVVGMVIVDPDATLFTICAHGYGKRSSFDEYPKKGRAGIGVRNIRTSGRNGDVVALLAVREDQGVMMVSEKGMAVRIPTADVSLLGRGTQGVRVMRLNAEDRIVAVAVIAERPDSGDPLLRGPVADGSDGTDGPDPDDTAEPPDEDLPDDADDGDGGDDPDGGDAGGDAADEE